jgi:hypothetical protein
MLMFGQCGKFPSVYNQTVQRHVSPEYMFAYGMVLSLLAACLENSDE